MFFLAGLFTRSSLSFLFVTAIRFISVIACLLGIAAELFMMVEGIKGTVNAGKAEDVPDAARNGTSAQNGTSLFALGEKKLDCGYIGGTDVPKSFGGVVFFAIAQLFTILILTLCTLSELSPPKIPAFFDSFLPILGQTHGVGYLGALELFTGCLILSHNVGPFIAVAAWFLVVLGILNVFLGMIYRAGIRQKRSIFEAGKTYAKDVTHYDDLEKGVQVGKKGMKLGKSMVDKFSNISYPDSRPAPPPPIYTQPGVRVFQGSHQVV